MFFSRIRVLGNNPDELLKIIKSSDYDQHQLLWKLFPDRPDEKREYLFKRDYYNGFPQFYMVSKEKPVPLDGVLDVETRDYQPELMAGDQLSFTLRANPVRVRKIDESSNKRKRDDVVFVLKDKYKSKGLTKEEMPSKAELSQEAGEVWLSKKSERHGFKVDAVRADSYMRHRFDRKGENICYSTLDFQGTLTVTNPEKFTNVLFGGLGPAKAFGCGLMLIKRI